VGDRSFQISPNSFFQTNTKAVEKLYYEVARLAALQPDHTLYDLYSGAGAISLYLADRVDKVIGFEIVASAVDDAIVNSKLNGIENCVFVAGDLKDSLRSWGRRSHGVDSPDVIIIDPPRAGMHAKVVQEVAKLDAARIVYVSCNPTTFARDAKLLCDDEYQLEVVQPVDMFPHTPHIELVSLLSKIK
jgi:23S rRNA (uracil1939-C5)-methyltransferase